MEDSRQVVDMARASPLPPLPAGRRGWAWEGALRRYRCHRTPAWRSHRLLGCLNAALATSRAGRAGKRRWIQCANSTDI